jgi:hypothetical protein
MKVAGIKIDQATGEMKVAFVVDDATTTFQPLIGPKDKRVLLLTNMKQNVEKEPIKRLSPRTTRNNYLARCGHRKAPRRVGLLRAADHQLAHHAGPRWPDLLPDRGRQGLLRAAGRAEAGGKQVAEPLPIMPSRKKREPSCEMAQRSARWADHRLLRRGFCADGSQMAGPDRVPDRVEQLVDGLVGALIVAKVVLVLENIPLGALTRDRPAAAHVILRTVLYGLGVLVVLLLEKAFEARHEYGGFARAVVQVIHHQDIPHVLAAAIGVTGALLVFNALFVIRRHLGKRGLLRLFLAPLPEQAKEEH